MSDASTADTLEVLRRKLADFAAARDWEPFHTPKNLAMALIGEAGELIEHFQWLTPEQSQQLAPEQKAEVALELADIFLYLIRLADRLEIDLAAAAHTKIACNEIRYPAERCRGSARRASTYAAPDSTA